VSWVYRRDKNLDGLAREAESYVERGFRAMKMKIGRYDFTGTNFRRLLNQPELCVVTPEEDIARVTAVRKALGPNRRLMADANCVWSPATAIKMGKALEPYDLFWLEEPVATDDVDGSAEVAGADDLDRRIRNRGRFVRLSRADHPRRDRYRSARPGLVGRVHRMP
jgi:L-alanine-DL-glutamate epimerase-like enolase superfamily enzyme